MAEHTKKRPVNHRKVKGLCGWFSDTGVFVCVCEERLFSLRYEEIADQAALRHSFPQYSHLFSQLPAGEKQEALSGPAPAIALVAKLYMAWEELVVVSIN